MHGDLGGNQRYDDEVLAPHDEILNRLLAEFNGTVVGTAGDSYFVAFDDAQFAVRCAVSIQVELINKRIALPVAADKLPPCLQIRVGLHTGGARELMRASQPNYSDHTINIASRIAGFADAEQVLMSRETWNGAGRLDGVSKHEWPGYELKGVRDEWTLIEALWDGRLPHSPQLKPLPTFDDNRAVAPFILPQLDVATFTGRFEELERLEKLLLAPDGAKVCSIVGLSGAGGIGKSALACHFAVRYRDAFPDGVLGLRVDGKDNDTIAREFARLIGEEIELDDERQAATIMQQVFADRRALLIFDNAETADIEALRPGGQNCALIITTRDRQLPFLLGVPAAGIIDLSPLSPLDARHLLERLIGEPRVAAEPDAATEIINLVGSLPLALQIVGSALRMQQDRSISEYAATLRTERDRLDILKVRGASHLDVLASLTLSLRLLTDDEISFFACLSACATDGFSLPAAMAAGACDEATAYARLNYLYRLSLLNRPRLRVRRYLFHPLIRLFAQDLARERALQVDAAERHARYFIDLVKTNQTTAQDAAVLLADDKHDHMLAAAWLQQQNILDLQFVLSIEQYLGTYHYWQQSAKIMSDFLLLAEQQENWPGEAQLRIKHARYLFLLSDCESAEHALVLAADTIERLDDRALRQSLIAEWYRTLGGLRQREDRYEEAARAFQYCVLLAEERADLAELALVLNRLGVVRQRLGQFDEAVETLERCLVVCENLGDQRSIAMALNSLGGAQLRQGRFAQATASFARSYDLFVESGDQRSTAMVLNSLGGVQQRQGKFAEAEASFERSYDLLVEAGDRRGQAMLLTSLGGVLLRQRRLDDAAAALRQSAAIEEMMHNPRGLAKVLTSLGGVLQRQGRLEEAVDVLRRCLAIAEASGDERSIAMVLNSLGGVLQRQDHFDEAIDALKRSAEFEEKSGNQRGQAMVLTSLGVVMQRQGLLDDAAVALRRSAAIEEQIHNEQGQAKALTSLGGVLQRQRQYDEAVAVYRQALAIEQESGNRTGQAMVQTALGRTLLYSGNIEQGAIELDLAFVFWERHGEGHRLGSTTGLLAQALSKLGRRAEACEYIERALAVSPDDEQLHALLERLSAQVDPIIKRGIIKRIIPHLKGYRFGFIIPADNSEDTYFQDRNVQLDSLPRLAVGAEVEYEACAGGMGPTAENIRVI